VPKKRRDGSVWAIQKKEALGNSGQGSIFNSMRISDAVKACLRQ
jgi:hypothetical protein